MLNVTLRCDIILRFTIKITMPGNNYDSNMHGTIKSRYYYILR